jgi:hypothetical protein
MEDWTKEYVERQKKEYENYMQHYDEIREREKLEWIEEVKRINAKNLPKENVRTFRMLHDSGQLKLVKIHETKVDRNVIYDTRSDSIYRVKAVEAELDVSPEPEDSTLNLVRKGRKITVEYLDGDTFAIGFSIPIEPCLFMHCQSRNECEVIKQYVKVPDVCLRKYKRTRKLLKDWTKNGLWKKFLLAESQNNALTEAMKKRQQALKKHLAQLHTEYVKKRQRKLESIKSGQKTLRNDTLESTLK